MGGVNGVEFELGGLAMDCARVIGVREAYRSGGALGRSLQVEQFSVPSLVNTPPAGTHLRAISSSWSASTSGCVLRMGDDVLCQAGVKVTLVPDGNVGHGPPIDEDARITRVRRMASGNLVGADGLQRPLDVLVNRPLGLDLVYLCAC